MERIVLVVWAFLGLCACSGCATEPAPADGGVLAMRSLPPEHQAFSTNGPGRIRAAAEDDAPTADSVAAAWCDRLLTTPHALLTIEVERVYLVDGISPRVTGRHAARADMLMEPGKVWSACWVVSPEGGYDAEHPQMKYVFDGRVAREREWDAEAAVYRSTWSAPWHESGSDDFSAMPATEGCMVGSSTQSWLGDSHNRRHYVERLADCQLLYGTYSFGDESCRVLQFFYDSTDAAGRPTYRWEENHYFDDRGVNVGRDVRCWGKSESGREFRIYQRDIKRWRFDVNAADADALRALAAGGPEDPATATPPHLPIPGTPAPKAAVNLLDGGAVNLHDLVQHGPLVLDFWATWCVPCRSVHPIMERLHAEYAGKGARFIAVSSGEEAAAVRAFAAKHLKNIAVAIDSDGALARAFEAKAVPWIVVIGRDGVIRAVFRGAHDALEADLRQLLDDAMTDIARR
jgi:thiol-disulfide isomerase/thioredoxin